MTDLDEFRAAYEADDNHWWRTESGLHQVVFDEACDRLDAAETEVRVLRGVIAQALAALAAGDRLSTDTPDDYVCSTCGGLASDHPEDIPPDAPVTGDDDD